MNAMLQLTDDCFLSPNPIEGGRHYGPVDLEAFFVGMRSACFGWQDSVADWITENLFLCFWPGNFPASLQIKLREYNPAIDDFLETNPTFYLAKK